MVQDLDDWPNGQRRIVAMENVEVDVRCTKSFEREAKVETDLFWRHPVTSTVVVSALPKDEYVVAPSGPT
jgi:hypothetical protein